MNPPKTQWGTMPGTESALPLRATLVELNPQAVADLVAYVLRQGQPAERWLAGRSEAYWKAHGYPAARAQDESLLDRIKATSALDLLMSQAGCKTASAALAWLQDLNEMTASTQAWARTN